MNSKSPPPKKRRLGLQHNQEEATAPGIQNTRTTTTTTCTTRTTIHQLSEDVIGIVLTLLGGNGHFRYGPTACKTLLRASELNTHFKKITTGESVTSSVSCAKKYFEDEGTGEDELQFFWFNAARYGRIDVMEWAHQQEFSDVWSEYSFGARLCQEAAVYGQLQPLQWLRENGCPWNGYTCEAAACNGNISILQWARENGCPWDVRTCIAAAENGHLSILQWARGNGCPWDALTCKAAAENGHLLILQWARENGCPEYDSEFEYDEDDLDDEDDEDDLDNDDDDDDDSEDESPPFYQPDFFDCESPPYFQPDFSDDESPPFYLPNFF